MMDTAQSFERIKANTFTIGDWHQRFVLLQDFLNTTLFKETSATSLSAALVEHFPATHDKEHAAAVAAWGDDFLGSFSAQGLHDDLKTLQTYVEAQPTLIIYAPVALSNESARETAAWARTNIDQSLLLDCRIDASALGGCKLVWHNKLLDFSFEYFAKKHEAELRTSFAQIIDARHHSV